VQEAKHSSKIRGSEKKMSGIDSSGNMQISTGLYALALVGIILGLPVILIGIVLFWCEKAEVSWAPLRTRDDGVILMDSMWQMFD
jgi:hypothetical protein